MNGIAKIIYPGCVRERMKSEVEWKTEAKANRKTDASERCNVRYADKNEARIKNRKHQSERESFEISHKLYINTSKNVNVCIAIHRHTFT